MYEVKKIMLCQRGLFYIALVLLFGTVWLALSDNPVDIAMEQYKNEYEWYLERHRPRLKYRRPAAPGLPLSASLSAVRSSAPS